MLTVPTALWPYLLSTGFRCVEVYELEAFAGRSILRYSSQDLTWGGNAYTGLAVARSPIKQSMEFRVPDCEVTFSNVTNVLRAHLWPVDTLTGARMTIRLLIRDASNALLTDSLVLFRGVIEPPKEISEEHFTLSVVGLLDGRGIEIPARRFSLTCPWQFANKGAFDGNGHCSYVSSTQANGAGASSSALIMDSPSFFKNGDVIQIGGGVPTTITSGGGTTTVGITPAQTWADNALVRFADCPGRTMTECTARQMTHRFGGFPAVATTSRLGRQQRSNRENRQGDRDIRRPGGPVLSGGPGRVRVNEPSAGEAYADPTTSAPILYGRRRISPRLIELLRHVVGIGGFQVGFYALSEGEIDSVVRYFVDDEPGVDRVESSIKTFGIYLRDGDPGVADYETAAEYLASPTTQLRTQNIDYRSLALVAYSETAYAILLQKETDEVSSTPNFETDIRGVKVQRYTTTGALDGAKAWSDNPIWHAVDLCLSDKHGLGAVLTAADLDFAVTRPEADHASELITSSEASTLVTAIRTASTQCMVGSTEGFIVGRRVDVNSVANTVADIVSDVELTLGTPVTTAVNQVVVQRPARFEAHIYLDRVQSATWWFDRLLVSCRGYVTYDAGKIQLRIERDTCKERLTDGGMEIWTTTSNLTNWTENTGLGEATFARDSDVGDVAAGTYSCRIDRSAGTQFAGISQAFTGLEPGRWYRIVYKHKQSATGGTMTFANRLRLSNTTQNLQLNSDGITWAAPTANAIVGQGSTSFVEYEFTFKWREDFLATDSFEIAFCPNFSGGSVWIDAASMRGPYGGDFREFTTANVMGWKEGSFVWSLDRKDRETNRIAVRFVNESDMFGNDETSANDFTHQQTHPINTLSVDGSAIADRDQANRIAKFALAKRRTLGPGCEFVGSPAALALQPGDIISVSHTVPSWTGKEQRVIETDISGLGDEDEFFVVVRTEDYQASIYSDVGALQNVGPTRPTPVVGATIKRNSGGVLELLISVNDSAYAVRRYAVHMSDATGFSPDATTLIGASFGSRFIYHPHVDDLDVLRFFRIVAVIDRGTLMSEEFSTTIYRPEITPPGPTYSGAFQFPTTRVVSAGTVSGANADVIDASDATYNEASASITDGSPDGNDDTWHYHTFGAGGTPHTVRPYVRAARTANVGVFGKIVLEYTTDRSIGSPVWTPFQTVTNLTPEDFYGPELVAADYAKIAIRVRVYTTPTTLEPTGTVTGRVYRAAFDLKA